MNFAVIATLMWLFTIPETDDPTQPRDRLINGGIYIIRSEADADVLSAWDPGVSGYRPGYVNTTKWKVAPSTAWSIQYFPDNRFFTVRSQSQNNTHNELALVVEQSRDGKRPDTYNRYWNLTFAGRSFGHDKWIIIDFGKGTGSSSETEKCLENAKDGQRVLLNGCNPENRRQRWKFCLCKLPPLPKGVDEKDRVLQRI